MLKLPCENIRWRQFNSNFRECMNVKIVTNNLLDLFIKDISKDKKNEASPKVIVLIHHGDSVKNITDDQNDAEEKYNVLTSAFKNANYSEKINIMRPMPQDVDFRLWSRQQWPMNTINYTLVNNIKLVYIQADYNYCRYPSMFAEAMCNTLYDTYYRVDDLFYYASSSHQMQSLYNVGNYDICNKLAQIAEHHNIPVIRDVPGDIEWAMMAESYLNSLYNILLRNKQIPLNTYIFYPWKVIYNNWPSEIKPISVTISSLSQGSRQARGTYIRDLNLGPRDRIIVKGVKFDPSWENIPLVILGDKINTLLKLGVGPNLFISPTIIFDGTFDNPRIFVDNDNMFTLEHVNFLTKP